MLEQIVTDGEIKRAFDGMSAGLGDPRKTLEQGCLRILAGYKCTPALNEVIRDLGLASDRGLLKKGKMFLYQSFQTPANQG